MIKRIILSMAFLLLNACASQYANVVMRSYEISNNKMSMVVTRISIPYIDLLNKSNHYDGYLRLANVESKGKKKIYLIKGGSYLDSATMITPGAYYVDSIGWSDGLYVYDIKIPAKSLDVKPGQCIYIGDISIAGSGKHRKILVKNNIPNAILEIENSKLNFLAKKLHFDSIMQDITTKKGHGNAWDSY
ncbi:MAG TPA: hypothetical protein VNK03_05600 [Gammaproteobacteria bacterium]|nr:hypothetical protein [Gammaproteobacteria bacterium]